MKELRKKTKKYNLFILEDACHAPGAAIENEFVVGDCTLSDAAIFSFHPVKHISCGEGGMITTNDFDLFEKIKLLRTHGITKERDKLVGRKVWWREEPAIITMFLDDACVVMEPDGLEKFKPTAYRDEIDDEEDQFRVKNTIHSPHIWWYRDNE